MALVSLSSPFDRLLNLQRTLDRVLNAPPAFDMGISGRGAFPPVNVFGDQDSYLVRLEAPGLNPDELNIESHGRTLTLSGQRKAPTSEEVSFHRRERVWGSFSRSVQIPAEGDLSRAEASYKHGLLTIRIPKREEAMPRKIDVKVA